MKKILASLLVLALCTPAMAATIGLAVTGTNEVTITVDSTADAVNMVGLGLDVDVTGGTCTAVSISTANFNIYPDAANTLGVGYTYGAGSPVAAQLTAGEISLPQSSFALSFGNLNGSATAGADGASVVEVVLTLDSSWTDVDVCENATRGGIVAVDGTALDAACDTVVNPGGGCYTGPDVVAWQAVGEPASWCNPRQCEGDADGLQEGNPFTGYYWVGVNDLNAVISGWKTTGYVDPVTHPWIAADFDHAEEGNPFTGYYRVGVNDLNILIGNWKSDANILADCLD